MILEFQCAYRVSDAFDGILIAVREVIHRIYAPLVPGPVVASFKYPVDNGISHVQVAARHVYLGSEHPRALFKFAFGHPHEEVKVFLHASLPVRRIFPRLCQSTPLLPHLLCALVVDIGFAGFDKVGRPNMELVKVI